MRRNPSFIVQVERRLFQLRQTAAPDTQQLRTEWIDQLNVLFRLAISIVKQKNDVNQIGDNPEKATPKERQMWAHMAAHTALVMGNLAKGYDETKFNEDLAELERLVDEIKKLQAQRVKEGDNATEERTSDTHIKPESSAVTGS